MDDNNPNVWTIILLAIGSFSGSLWVFASRQEKKSISVAQEMSTLFAGFLFGSIFGAILGHIVVEKWFSDTTMIASFVYGAAASICTLLSGGIVKGLLELDVGTLIEKVLKKQLGIQEEKDDL